MLYKIILAVVIKFNTMFIIKIIISVSTRIRGRFLRAFRSLRSFIFVDLRKVLQNYMKHDGELSTCAIAFFFFISFIPASLVIISILSYFYKSDAMASLYIDQIKNQLPSIDIHEIIDIIDRIVYKKRYLAFIWVPFLLWWGSLVFDILENALGKAFRIEESRIYWKAKIRHFIIIIMMGIIALAFTLFSHIIAIIKNSDILTLINIRLERIPLLQELLIQMGNIPLALSAITTLVINTTVIFVMYRFVPPRKLDNHSLLRAALFASFSYELIKTIFSFYITEINDYSSIFGSLSSIVILMIWIWYTCFIFVIGAEMAWVFYENKQSSCELVFDPVSDE